MPRLDSPAAPIGVCTFKLGRLSRVKLFDLLPAFFLRPAEMSGQNVRGQLLPPDLGLTGHRALRTRFNVPVKALVFYLDFEHVNS